MVRQGDFEISLVYAETKEPFKEHTKDGKVYVEVEPDEEYFIRIQRVGNSAPGLLLACPSVDTKALGYFQPIHSNKEPAYLAGLWTLKDGTSTQTALKFTKPRLTQEGGQQPVQTLMGKVEVNIHEGTIGEVRKETSNIQSTWETSTIDQAQVGGLAEKKALRSGEGSTSVTMQTNGQVTTYKKGKNVDVITLNYCTAVGLIQVGALPKPPLWVYHRMLHPAKKRSTTVVVPRPAETTSSDILVNDLANLKIRGDRDKE